jgi:hypothetical protein
MRSPGGPTHRNSELMAWDEATRTAIILFTKASSCPQIS